MLDDLPTLHSAILASRAFSYAFREAKSTILSRVLIKHVGVDVMPEALVAIKAVADIPIWTEKSIGTFCSEHLQIRGPVPSLYTPGKVAAMAKLSATVKALTERFVPSITTSRLKMPTSTPSERARIERAFYRFETFCTLFRPSPSCDDILLCMDKFFCPFSPWELEQLGCIHDFLFHLVKPGKCHHTP
jgi:hypothetical protein